MDKMMKLTTEEEQLILKLRQEKAKAAWKPVTAACYTDIEKIQVFNKLYEMALDHYNYLVEHGNVPKDGDHYMFEAVMELLGKGIWDAYDAILK